MTRRFVFVLLYIFGCIQSAWADRIVGNGGHLVVCKDSAGRVLSKKVLDLYEAEHMGSVQIGEASTSLNEKIQLILMRLKAKDMRLAKDVDRRVHEFLFSTSYQNINLPESNDEGQVVLEDGCSLHQLALQQSSSLPGHRFFIVNLRFWKDLTDDDKASLILHEALYAHFTEAGAQTSQHVRLLLGLILRDVLKEMSQQEYKHFLDEVLKRSRERSARWLQSVATQPPPGTVFVELLNETFFKSSMAQAASLGVDKKCYLNAHQSVAVQVLSTPQETKTDYYRIKLRQPLPKCAFGIEGREGYFFANHIKVLSDTAKASSR